MLVTHELFRRSWKEIKKGYLFNIPLNSMQDSVTLCVLSTRNSSTFLTSVAILTPRPPMLSRRTFAACSWAYHQEECVQTLTVILLISLSSVHHRIFIFMSIDLDSALFVWSLCSYGAPRLKLRGRACAGRLALLLRAPTYVYRSWWVSVWPAMALPRILSLCSVLLVARQVFAESGELERLEQPLEPERGELQGIQVSFRMWLINLNYGTGKLTCII